MGTKKKSGTSKIAKRARAAVKKRKITRAKRLEITAAERHFQVSGPLDPANQSILGLPLMNNYYVVFDRSLDSQGVIRFAPIKPPTHL